LSVAGANLPSYTVPTARTNTTDYYVVVTNIFNSVMSQVAHVSVVPDEFPLVLLSAVAGTPLTRSNNQAVATFDKTVLRNAASLNVGNYSITPLGTTNRVLLTNVMSAGSQVRLSAATDFVFGTNYVLTVNNVSGTNLIPSAPNSQIGITMVWTNPPATNTSPVPPRLGVIQQSPSTQVISWPTNVGGLEWGLETTTNPTTDAWKPLGNPSPYTNNSTSEQKFFRLRVR